jgi:hypothetical protein
VKILQAKEGTTSICTITQQTKEALSTEQNKPQDIYYFEQMIEGTFS